MRTECLHIIHFNIRLYELNYRSNSFSLWFETGHN